MSAALLVSGLCKRYGWRSPLVLDDLSLEVPVGSLSGLVGPNGAGKTTLFAIVAGYLRSEAGSCDVLGLGPFHPATHKGRVGVLPQDAELPIQDTPRMFLEHLARLQGLNATEGRAAAAQSLEQVLLLARADEPIHRLSHGMHRRVSVASALLGSPELILLDEPMSGLDPMQAHSLRSVLSSLRGKATVIVSSHNLDELEKLCDHVVILEDGKLVRAGTIEEVTGRGFVTHWTLAATAKQLEAVLPRLRDRLEGHSFDVQDGVLVHRAPDGSDLDAASHQIAGVLVDVGFPIREVARGLSLEASFLRQAGV